MNTALFLTLLAASVLLLGCGSDANTTVSSTIVPAEIAPAIQAYVTATCEAHQTYRVSQLRTNARRAVSLALSEDFDETQAAVLTWATDSAANISGFAEQFVRISAPERAQAFQVRQVELLHLDLVLLGDLEEGLERAEDAEDLEEELTGFQAEAEQIHSMSGDAAELLSDAVRMAYQSHEGDCGSFLQ